MASNVKVDKITPTTNCGTVTLGDSGDTISIPSGASLSVGGTVSGIDGIVSWDTTAKTAAFTAVAGNGYFVDTTSAAITVTLPASPSAGDLVAVKDYAFTADTNNITLARNGSNIQGTANDFLIDTEGRSVTLIYVDATQGWLLTGASQKSDVTGPLFTVATGGTVTTCGDYKIHTFTGPGTFSVTQIGNSGDLPSGGPAVVDYLVVAGGGSGGGGDRQSRGSSAGGGGGFRESHSSSVSGCYTASPLATPTGITLTVQDYPITVGAGATTPSPAPNNTPGNVGSSSIFSTITSGGGGGGMAAGGAHGNGAGGSGGGASAGPGRTGATGNSPPVSPPQGQPGGDGGPSSGAYQAGGGGGATAAGQDGPAGGTGGAGAGTNINTATGESGPGPSRYYSGGGAGGGFGPAFTAQTGGIGGGADRPDPPSWAAGEDGTANTGGAGSGTKGQPGGGSTPTAGGAGGSGIVIIRYKYQ